MALRGIRGATGLTADDAVEMHEAVTELLQEMVRVNSVPNDALVSVILTCTPDLHSAFPAAAARRLGWTDVPLLCAQELDITGAMPRVVRVLLHVDVDIARADIRNVYLRGTENLRQDPLP